MRRELSLKELLENVEADMEESRKRICELKEEIGDPIGTSEYVTDDDNLISDIENDLERLYERTNVTDNYADHQQEISKLSIVDLIRVVNYVKLLSSFVNENNEVLDDLDNVVEPFEKVIRTLRTETLCPRCQETLYKSDCCQYNYVCQECDENFD